MRDRRDTAIPYDRNTFVWEDFSTQMKIDSQEDSRVPEELITTIDPSVRTHWAMVLSRVNGYIQSLSPRNKILIEKTAV